MTQELRIGRQAGRQTDRQEKEAAALNVSMQFNNAELVEGFHLLSRWIQNNSTPFLDTSLEVGI